MKSCSTFVTYFWLEFYKFTAPTIQFDHLLCLWRGAMGVGSWSGIDGGTGLSLRREGMLENVAPSNRRELDPKLVPCSSCISTQSLLLLCCQRVRLIPTRMIRNSEVEGLVCHCYDITPSLSLRPWKRSDLQLKCEGNGVRNDHSNMVLETNWLKHLRSG